MECQKTARRAIARRCLQEPHEPLVVRVWAENQVDRAAEARLLSVRCVSQEVLKSQWPIVLLQKVTE